MEVESDTIDLIVYAIDEDNWVLGGQNVQPIESNGYEESVEHERSRLIEDGEDLEEDDQDHQYDLRGNKETPENPQNPEKIQEDQLLTGPPYNREAENLRILSQQIQEKRNQPKVNRLVNEQRMQMRHLPPEIWTIIINMCLKNDPSLRFTLRYVCNTFRNIVDLTPFPQIYIAPEVLLRVPTPVSIARLITRAGRQSGLAVELRRIFTKSRWYQAWLHLRELDNRWFRIVYIWWRRH